MMILAGAGTGKTRVITYRIAHMLHKGVPPGEIVALSFTNKAAREMSERVKHLVGGAAKHVWLGTFHSFCLHILRSHAQAAGLASRFGLAGTADQLDLVRRALEEKNWQGLYQSDQMHYRIGIAKTHPPSPDDPRAGRGRAVIRDDFTAPAEVYTLYERQLKLNRVIDFDDCIYKCVRLLRDDAAVRADLRRKYRYLLVDEYQDTNAAQLAVLESLASDSHDVCVVGDDDQSIYSWRGAMYEVLERFEQMFPGSKIVKLEQNYRCSNVILTAANTVIKNNVVRKDKTLWSASEETTPIMLLPLDDEQAEARFVAEKCMSLLGGGLEPKDIGVLYRANAQARPIELALREARINYRTFGGQSFFEKKEVKDFLCYVRLVLNHEDRLALWRVVNTPHRGIGLKTLEAIEELATSKRLAPFVVMRRHGDELESRAAQAVRGFVDLIDRLTALPLSTAADYEQLGSAIIKDSGLEQEIRAKTDNGAQKDRKIENLRSLPGWLATLAKDQLEENGMIDPQELLDTLCLDNDRREEQKKGHNHVSLMTMHAAKGLEFPAVFVVGLEEDLLPHKNSAADPKALCEERRLFYVALTRAKQRLYLTYCLERASAYQRQSRNPSRFLRELPENTYTRAEGSAAIADPAKRTEVRRTGTASALGKMRENLATGRWK
jgi:DNA helicase-2/ATP-dependent DNA helicase PcrA